MRTRILNIRLMLPVVLTLCFGITKVHAQCTEFIANLDGTVNAPDPVVPFSGTFPFCTSLNTYPSPLDPFEQSVAPFSAFCPANVGIKNRGLDTSYQVIVGDDFIVPQLGGAETEGRLAARGDLIIHRQYGIAESGGGTFVIGAPDVAISIDGSLSGIGSSTTGSSSNAGSTGTYMAQIGGTAAFDISGALMYVGSPPTFNTGCLINQSKTASTAMAALPATGAFSSGFAGTNADLEVFHINGSNLSGNGILPFSNIKAGATIIINVAGTNVTYGAGVFNGRVNDPWAAANVSDQDAQVYNVVWNFYQATDVSVVPNPAGGIQGLVLIPNGDLNLGTNLNGRVYVGGSLTHSGEGTEIHNYPFSKNLDDVLAGTSCTCVPSLPVELTAFHAEDLGTNAVQLVWQTATETDNAGFEIQMNRDGWQPLGFVNGFGTTSEAQSYRYQVNDLGPGQYQFRLKQIDYDGSFDYSPIVEVEVGVPGHYFLSKVYPNPFNPQATLNFAVAKAQPVKVSLFDTHGRLLHILYEGVAEAEQNQTLHIDGANLPSGQYLVRMTGASFTDVRKVVLLK